MFVKENKFSVVIFLLFLILFTFPKNNYAQEDIIRVNTDLVLIPVTVVDRNSRYITDLKKENFQIYEDGVEQEISSFESIEQPFTVFLLLDRSGSMSNHMEDLTLAANTFFSQLRPNDQIITATFADNVDLILKSTKVKDLKKVVKIRQRRGDSYTRLYDAVDYALKKMKKIRGRKVIILFSDGYGDGIFSSFEDNIRDVEENEAIFYTIQFNTFPKIAPDYVTDKKKYQKRIEIADNYMRDLAQITGGRSFSIENITNLEKTFAQVAKELGQQYSLGYYPKQSGKVGERRQIKVKVNLPNVAVRARDSYFIGTSKNK